jgi:hypothetical protein
MYVFDDVKCCAGCETPRNKFSDSHEGGKHGLINFIDTKPKWRHLKKFTFEGTLRHAGVYLSEVPSPPMTHTHHPCYTMYTVYLFTQERVEGGGEES